MTASRRHCIARGSLLPEARVKRRGRNGFNEVGGQQGWWTSRYIESGLVSSNALFADARRISPG